MYGIRHLHLQDPGSWSPFEELERLQASLALGGASSGPAIDVRTEGDTLRLCALVPGVKPENLEITVEGDALTIRGPLAAAGPRNGDRWLLRERAGGKFERTLQLPFAVEADAVKARVANGVLEMELPRSAAEKPRRIPVQTT